MPRAYRVVVALARFLCRVFFRRVEVVGLDSVPVLGGGIVVAWHPNGLVDPALILAHFPRQLVFAARHGLFRWPLFGRLMRAVGAVPLFRPQDGAGLEEGERRNRNAESLQVLARTVVRGSFSALFPEGVSHDDPQPQALRPGVARLFDRAQALAAAEGEPPPVILPVGLHYDKKRLLGSRALVVFHPPLELPPELSSPPPPDASTSELEARSWALTAAIERVLHDVVHATESWELNQLMHRVRKLLRAERALRAATRPGAPDMRERVLAFSRVWSGYRERRRTHPEEVRRLMTRVGRYDRDLRALDLDDHELDLGALPAGSATARLVLRAAALFFVFPPLLVFGYLVNLPTALALLGYTKLRSSLYKDEASIKVLGGALVFPVTWILVALAVAWGQWSIRDAYPSLARAPWLAAGFTILLCVVSGALALHYHRWVGETARAVRVRLTRAARARTIVRLRQERARIHDAVERLAAGLELPGLVAEDGRVLAE